MSALLKGMLTLGETPSADKAEGVDPAPDEAPEGHEDMIVFMRDFENSDLSASNRLAALIELVKLIK